VPPALKPRPALAVAGAAAAPADPEALGWRPPQLAPAARRALKHPRLTPYHRLIAGVVLVNLGLLLYHLGRGDWLIDDGSALSALGGLALVNLTAAVLIRQQNVLNVLFGLAGRGSRSWPLWLRWSISKVHHVGGIHAGGALAGTAWLCAFTSIATVARARHPESVSLATVALSYCLFALAVLVVVCASRRCACALTTSSSCPTGSRAGPPSGCSGRSRPKPVRRAGASRCSPS
jgi:hypothetical protein